MGIKNLLDLFRENNVERPITVKEFAGCTVAVDTYCLLHRGAVGMIDRNGNHRDNGQYVRYVFKYVEMLLDNGVKPLLVFDGLALPAKAPTRKKRREQRENNRKKAEDYRRSGEFEKARSALMQAVEVTSDMAYAVICECRARGVDYIVAPYEADAELAYLNRVGIADAVWTVDADLLLFGCNKVIYNMDECGRGLLYEVTLDNLRLVCGVEKTRVEFSFEHFRRMCILSGCDYLESPRGVGIRTARSAMQKALATGQTDVRGLIARVAQLGGTRCHIEPNYVDAFVEAELTFLHQLVYDPLQRRLVPLNPYSSTSAAPLSPNKRTDNHENETENRSFDFAGHHMPQELAHWLAVGNVNVNTRHPIGDAKFDPTTNRSFLERVCTTLRERSEKFLRNERTRARRVESQSSRTGAAAIFSFECEKAPLSAPVESKGLTKSGLSIWDPRFPAVLRGGQVGELQNLPAPTFPAARVFPTQTQTQPASSSQRHSPQKRKMQATNADDNTASVVHSYLNLTSKRCKLDEKTTAHHALDTPDPEPNPRDTKSTPTDSENADAKRNCNANETPIQRLDVDSALSPILIRRSCLSRSNSNRFAVTTNGTDAPQSVRPVDTLASPPEIGTASRYFDSSPSASVIQPQEQELAPPPLSTSSGSGRPVPVTDTEAPTLQSPTAFLLDDAPTLSVPNSLENGTPCSSALSRFRLVASSRTRAVMETTAGIHCSINNADDQSGVTPFLTPKRSTQAPANAESSGESDDVQFLTTSKCATTRANVAQSNPKPKSKPKQNLAASARSGCRVSGLSRYRHSTSTSASASQSKTSAPQQATLHRWLAATPTSH